MFYNDIETERLILKNLSWDDKEFMLEHFSNDDVNRYLFDAEPLRTIEQANRLINFYLVGDSIAQHRWIINLKESGKQVGTCGFHCLDQKKGSVELGYDLRREYWGRGIMSEAVGAMLSCYVSKLGVSRVEAHIAENNERSLNLVKRLGFVFANETRTLLYHGEAYLHYVYTLYVKQP